MSLEVRKMQMHCFEPFEGCIGAAISLLLKVYDQKIVIDETEERRAS